MEISVIQHKIYEVRGKWVILDRDLAQLYGVTTSALNQAVKRNIKRFPPDFMFQLTDEETGNWKSQIVITKSIAMGLRRNPNAFTEQGVAMLSGLLNSDIAINDLSEDMRSEIDNLYQAIAELSLKSVETEKPRAKIGFKTSASTDGK